MGTIAHLVVKVSASTSDFDKAMAGLGKSMASTGAKLKSVGGSLTAGLTLPLVGVATAAVRMGADFEREMNKIQGVLRPTGTEFDALRMKAQEMGKATMFSSTDAATALLELGKAGLTSKEAIEGIDEVLQLAAASGLSMGESAELSARTISAFGLGIGDLARVNDVLAAAVNASTLEIGDLQTAFGYVGPLAKGFGLSIEDVTAALALMRDAGIAPETAGRGLREGLGHMANPTKGMEDVMGELGISSFTDANGQLLGLSEIIGMLDAKGLTAAQSLRAFGDAAGPGMFALVSQGQAALDGLTTKLQNSDGAAKAMADAMMTGLPGALERLKGSVETAFVAISSALEPVLIPVLNALATFADFVTTKLVPGFQALPVPVQTVAVGFGILLAAIGPMLLAGGTLMAGFGGLVTLFPMLGTTVTIFGGVLAGIVTGPFALVAAGLAAAVIVWTVWGEDITRIVSGVYASAKTWLVDQWEGSIAQSVAQMLGAMGMLYGALAGKALEGLQGVYQAAQTWLVDKLQPVVAALTPIINGIAGAFTTAKNAITTIVTETFTAIKTWLLDKFTAIVQGIKGKIDAVTGYFRDMYTAVVGRSYVPDMIEGIAAEFGSLASRMVQPAMTATGLVKDAFATMASAVRGVVQNLIGDLSGKLTGWMDGFMPSWAAKLTGGFATSAMQAGLGMLGKAAGGGMLGTILGGGASAAGGSGGILGSLLGGGAAAGGIGAGTAAGGAGAAGTAGTVGAGIGLGTTLAVTGGAAAAAVLAWAIVKKGLFRGGEEALKVNPARDEFLSQYGGAGTGSGSGFANLAAKLTEITGEHGGGQLFTMLKNADTMKEFENATQEINAKLAGATKSLDATSGNLIAGAQAKLDNAIATGASPETIRAIQLQIDTFKMAAGDMSGSLTNTGEAATLAAAQLSVADAKMANLTSQLALLQGTSAHEQINHLTRAIDALRESLELATPAVEGIGDGRQAGFALPSRSGEETSSTYTGPGFDPSHVEGGGGPAVVINAGTIIGNPDELAEMVTDAWEGGGAPFNRFRILSAQAAT